MYLFNFLINDTVKKQKTRNVFSLHFMTQTIHVNTYIFSLKMVHTIIPLNVEKTSTSAGQSGTERDGKHYVAQ